MQRRTKTDPYQYITQTIKNNFPKNCRVFLFWSRAKWTADIYSDRDIGIIGKQKIPYRELLLLNRLFEESAYRVDIVDFFGKDDHFTQNAMKSAKFIL